MKKKILALLVIALLGAWGADRAGLITLPFLNSENATTAQERPRFFGGRRNQKSADPVPVLTAALTRQDVPVTIDGVGTVQALNTVVVRAQVEGRLMELGFRDGQDVKKGDVLARLDARTYQALYDQVVAKKAQDEAQLENARIDLERYARLAAGNFGSRQQADTQKATVAQLEAQVRVDQAAIDNAKAILDYTTIRAPIDGRTGLRSVDVGNIIRASDATGIVTLTQVKPVAAVFNLPQQYLRALVAGQSRGRLKVDAMEADNASVIQSGEVEVIDNQVDVATGTVRVKAVFANGDLGLWPGQFINVRVYVDVLRQALVAPSSAIQRGPKGAFVYVLTPETKAAMKLVAVGRQDENIAVIQSGAEPGDVVITTGFGQITDGTLVRLHTPAAQPEGAQPDGASAEPRQRGPGQGRREGQARPQPQGGAAAVAR